MLESGGGTIVEEELIYYAMIPNYEICEFDRKAEVKLNEGNFSVTARIKEEFNIIPSYYIELYSDSKALKELSDLRGDDMAFNFLKNLMNKAKEKLRIESEKSRESERKRVRKRVMEIIDELTIQEVN